MSRRTINLIIIIVLLAAVIWVDLPSNPGISIGSFKRSLQTVLGLDLRGGMQVLLEVDLPATATVTSQNMADARSILENRSNALGVSEVVFQVAGARRIVGEFPGVTNPDEVISVLKETGNLEFVDMGDTPGAEGQTIVTDYGKSGTLTPTNASTGVSTATTAPTPTAPIPPTATTTLQSTLSATEQAAASATSQPTATPTATSTEEATVWHTIMTGDQLDTVSVGTNQLGKYVINFTLKSEGAKIFADYTSANVGKYLAIVLDKKIISVPSIHSAITEGSGQIEGSFTLDSANALAIQLRYGALPIPLKVVETRVIGPTLGQDSLNKSILAGAIGFAIVALFMLIYYRLPGFVAILAIASYALITLAIFKFIPVTLTLPGIAGFLLSTGGALDANILMFERMKEELRSGRTLGQALELGWKRAWPSIRDSNLATLITSIILFWFGSQYGATIVKGFALTLLLGVVISLFSAIVTTRTLLSLVFDLIRPSDHEKWIGA